MRQFIAVALVAILLGCPGTSTTSATPDSQNQNQTDASPLTGRWLGASGGLTVSLTIQQSGDSLSGTGTFEVAKNANIGCGGETLPASGRVTFAGKLAANEIQGRMTFADTWTPPYLATRAPPDSINGHFMSIDRGGCSLVLVRQR